jgi:hypothetical protein
MPEMKSRRTKTGQQRHLGKNSILVKMLVNLSEKDKPYAMEAFTKE